MTPRNVINECTTVNIFGEAENNFEIFMDMMLSRNILARYHKGHIAVESD